MEVIIKPRAPFDFAATARFLRFTEAEAVDTFAGGIYRRAIHFENQLHLLKVESRGTLARPRPAEARVEAGGTARAESDAFARELYDQPSDWDVVDATVAVARERGVEPAQVAPARERDATPHAGAQRDVL
jgi:hypothetical protein